jgi:hypothetical protein
MSQRESRLSRKITLALGQAGYWTMKVVGNPAQRAGVPDILVCADGLFVGLEVKHEETRSNTSARQDYELGSIRKCGGAAGVVCSPEEALDFIRAALAKRDA